MVCKNCGSEMKDGDIFCEKCGNRVDTEVKDTSSSEMPTVIDDKRVTVNIPTGDDINTFNEMLKSIWPDWTLVKKLGEGSFGKVYKADRTEMGNTFSSAIKIISIPQNDAEIETIRAEAGIDDEASSSEYFRTLMNDCVNEIKMMESFKGTQNIVSVEDYKVVPHENKIGWTIFIRMELLTSFISYQKNKVMTEKEVIKLGIDICNALEFCSKLNVMHRDIKPENIFVSPFGDYKLGDFGIARKLEKSSNGMSRKGTYNYMAPEVYAGNGQYDFKTDIYSLGIVLYKLLNNNRFPLVDARSNAVTHQQLQDAFDKRMAGVRLPKPMAASDALANVILLATSYNPEDRFSTAAAFKAALMNVQSGKADKLLDDATVAAPGNMTVGGRPAPAAPAKPAEDKKKAEKKPKKEKAPKKEKKKMSKGKKFLIIFLTLLILIGGTAGTLAIMWFTGAEYKILKALDEGEFNTAAEIYISDIDVATSVFTKLIDQKLDATKDGFTAKTVEFKDAEGVVATIEGFAIEEFEEKVTEIKKYITELNASRTAFETAEKLFAKKDWVGAMENYKKVAEIDADYKTAQTKYKDSVNNFRDDALSKAAGYVEDSEYAKAIEELENALKVLDGDKKLIATRDQYRADHTEKAKQDQLDAAAKQAEEGNYPKAIEIIEKALDLETFKGDKELTAALEQYNKEYRDKTREDAIEKAETYIEKGDYPSAMKAVEIALEKFPDDIGLKDAFDEYTDEYVESILIEADKYVAEKNIPEAIKVIEKALKVIPKENVADTKKLNDKKKEVEGKQPVSLSAINVLNGGWSWAEGEAVDPFGNLYPDVCNFRIFHGNKEEKTEHYAEYRLDGKYESISGILCPYKDIPENGTAIMKVFVQKDEGEEYELAYTSPAVTRKTDAFGFEADVKGAKYMKIVIEISSEHGEADYLLLMDVQLWA